LWAYVKNFVALSTSSSSNAESLQQLMRLGFYGEPARNHGGVTAALCERLIGHCLKWMNEFIAADEEMDETVEDLSLAGEPEANLWEDMEVAQEEGKAEAEEESEEDAAGWLVAWPGGDGVPRPAHLPCIQVRARG
jgi:hypothetical protein